MPRTRARMTLTSAGRKDKRLGPRWGLPSIREQRKKRTGNGAEKVPGPGIEGFGDMKMEVGESKSEAELEREATGAKKTAHSASLSGWRTASAKEPKETDDPVKHEDGEAQVVEKQEERSYIHGRDCL